MAGGARLERATSYRFDRKPAVPDILNISCYQFVPLPDAEALRELLAERAAQHALKGTVLLAEEGINFFLAGPADALQDWAAERQHTSIS